MNPGPASFYTTGGTLSQDAPSYVERQADRDLLDGLRVGEFCYVLTSRQMGKSSLMVRTATKLREDGTRVIALDLTAVGQNVTPEQWYDGLLAQIGRQLRLEDRLESAWRSNERLGPCQRFFAAIRDVILPQIPAALVIFVDEIDTVRSLPFSTDEFFAAIRECYNRRGQDAEFRRLTFCLLGVATPSDLIRDTRTTPFNIGRRIELHDFTEEEAAPLAKGMRHSASNETTSAPGANVGVQNAGVRGAQRLLNRILYWTGGHPYLTQRFCRAIAEEVQVRGPSGVDRLGEALFFTHRAKERDDNLLFVRDRLLRSETDVPSLLELYLKVRQREPVPDDETSQRVSVLRLSGIVKSARGRLVVRNRIYSRVFDRAWVHANMPGAEVRRQREAFNRGVLRTACIAALVVTALAIAVVTAVWQKEQAKRALATARYAMSQAGRAGGKAGQQYEGLEALRAAREYYTNLSALRDEAIACLALADLKESTLGMSFLRQGEMIDLHPDFKIAAVAAPDGFIKICQLSDGQSLMSLAGDGRVQHLRFDPTGAFLAVGYRGAATNQLVVWDWRKRARLFSAPPGIDAEALDFSADGKKLAVGSQDGRIIIYGLPGGEVLDEWETKLDTGLARISQAIRLSPSGTWLASSSREDFYVEIWCLGNTQRLDRFYHPDTVHSLAWHPRGQILAAACGDSGVHFWQTNGVRWKRLTGHDARVTAVAFNRQGTLLASTGEDETIQLWIPATGRYMTLGIAGESFSQISFSGDGRNLAVTGGKPVSVRVFNVLGGELVTLPLQASGDDLRCIDFSPDNRLLLGACARQITFWETASGREIGSISSSNSLSALFSADSQQVVTSSDSGLFHQALRGGETANSVCLAAGPSMRMHGQQDALGMMSFSLDRTRFAVVRNDSILLGSADPRVSSTLATNFLGAHYSQLVLHPSNTWVATRSEDSSQLHLWDISNSHFGSATTAPPAIVPSGKYFAFSPDGRWLATCWDGEHQFYRVGFWQVPELRHPRRLASDQYAPMTFARDGRTVAVAWSRHTIQLLKLPISDGRDLELLATLEGPDRLPLESLAFSPNGGMLAAATDQQIVQLWNLTLLRERLVDLNLQYNWSAIPDSSP